MLDYRFRILNVFAETTLGGNPLAVFEDGSGLDDTTMQALALQFNLSETTFILPSATASARVRIFTPNFEMPFAGHPTLGTAHVVRQLRGTGDTITLEMRAGLIPVTAVGDEWTLKANAATTRPSAASNKDIAAALGLAEHDIAGTPLWVNTGSEQLRVLGAARFRPEHSGGRVVLQLRLAEGTRTGSQREIQHLRLPTGCPSPRVSR